jgi:hypothetical protein
MGHFQCWVFGLVFFTARDPLDRLPDCRRRSNPDGKTDLAAVSPRTADGVGPTGLVRDRPNRDATPDFPGACELSTADFANLAWPPQERLRGDLCHDGAGNPTTDATKATERFRRVTFGPLETG